MSEKIEFYHNPRCRKSREALAYLREKNVEPKIIEYLKDIPSADDLKMVLARLDMPVENLLRKEERIFKDKFKNKNFTTEEWIEIMRENPKLIQRPIIMNRRKAVIGRPAENIDEII